MIATARNQTGLGSLQPCFLGAGLQGSKTVGAILSRYLFVGSGAGEAASFWKRGSVRSGSNIGSSHLAVSGRFVFIFFREKKLLQAGPGNVDRRARDQRAD